MTNSTNKILLVIEGHEYSSNDPMIYRQKEGVYEMTFNKDINTFDTLTDNKENDTSERNLYFYL
jgi:hypothetical protein